RQPERVALALVELGQPQRAGPREQRERPEPDPPATCPCAGSRRPSPGGAAPGFGTSSGCGHLAQLRRRLFGTCLTSALLPGRYLEGQALLMSNDFSRAPRVLVVEDDEDIAQALQRSLRMEGYEVRAAQDGPGALEHGRAFAPDLVILDLGLPGLDGLEVAKTLRAEDDVPILILTARDALESR